MKKSVLAIYLLTAFLLGGCLMQNFMMTTLKISDNPSGGYVVTVFGTSEVIK